MSHTIIIECYYASLLNIIFCLLTSVHTDLWWRAEDSTCGLSKAQRTEAQRLQLRRPGQAAQHGAMQPAALSRLCLLAPPTMEAGTIVLTRFPPTLILLTEGASL